MRTLEELQKMLEDERSLGVLHNVLSELKNQGYIYPQSLLRRIEVQADEIRNGERPYVQSEVDSMIQETIQAIDDLPPPVRRSAGRRITQAENKMDDDYAASSVTKGGYPSCPSGKIRRVAYTRKNGVKVASKCIKDRGAVGRWQTMKRMMGIGPLKKGHLKGVGYDATASAPTRHDALDKAVKRYGRNSTIRKLNAIATYTKRTNPSRSKTYRTDMHYIQKKFA